MYHNPLRFGLVAEIGGVFIFIGKVFICGAATLLGYVIITRAPYYVTNLYSPILPTIAFFIVTYCIADCFQIVYGLASTAILTCFCLEEHLGQGVTVHCPENLK